MRALSLQEMEWVSGGAPADEPNPHGVTSITGDVDSGDPASAADVVSDALKAAGAALGGAVLSGIANAAKTAAAAEGAGAFVAGAIGSLAASAVAAYVYVGYTATKYSLQHGVDPSLNICG